MSERMRFTLIERWAMIAAARQRLEGLVAQIRSGIFEPAAEPYAALCFGCPAAPRLCPRPKWRPRRDAHRPPVRR